MILTKKGLKVWGSGMIVMLMSVGFTMLLTEEYIASMTLWEMAAIVLVLFPLAIGAVQSWYWTKGEPDDTVETL